MTTVAGQWRGVVALVALMLSAGSLMSCSQSAERGFYFSGYVRDGVTGEALPNYLIQLRWLDERFDGEIDEEGRYFIGPLEEFHDYSIEIRADGYRRFHSHNAMRTPAAGDGLQSFIFDAYLFPTDLPAPETSVEVYFDDDSMSRPTGLIRLRPTTTSLLFNDAAETPAPVGSQLWANDEDLLNATVLVELLEGVATIESGALAFGVTYDVTVLGVPGYQVVEGRQLVAGRDAFVTATISQYQAPPLELVFDSTILEPRPVDSVQAILVFNQNIAFDPRETDDTWRELIDNAVSINSNDDDADGNVNALRMSTSDTDQERGTSITINGNRLVLAWDTDGLETTDGDDRIRQVTFGALDNVGIRPVGGGRDTFTSLGVFTGSSLVIDILP